MTNTNASLAPVKFLEVKIRGTALVFHLGNGDAIEFDTANASLEMRERAMAHGFNQKLRDTCAGFSKDKDYSGAYHALSSVIAALNNNEWSRARGEGDSATQQARDLAEAIAKLRNASYEKALAAVQKAEPEQRRAWLKNAQIAAIVATLKADRAAKAAEINTGEIDFGL